MACKTKEKEVKKAKPAVKKEEPKKTAGVYRVTFNKETKKWMINRDGAERVIANYATKDEALARVKELSKNQDVGYTVKKKDGKFQKK